MLHALMILLMVFLFFHLLGGRLRAENHAFDVYAQHAVNFGFVQRQERAHRFHARVVHPHIQASERFNGFFGKAKLVGAVGNVALHGDVLPAFLVKFGFDFGKIVGVDVVQHHGKTVLRQAGGDGFAQTCGRTGYDGDFFIRHDEPLFRQPERAARLVEKVNHCFH